mgnify:CR=1 FL=1
MPWRSTGPVEERLRFVLDAEEKVESMAELCRQYDISRRVGYKWLDRYRQHGVHGLEDLSRAPHVHPNEIPPQLCERIVELRGEHPFWGAKKLKAYLEKREPGTRWPARSTINALLKARNLTKPRRRRRRAPGRATPLTVGDRPNLVWTADHKGWFKTRDGQRCYPLTICDDFSRFLIVCQTQNSCAYKEARPVFERAFREYGVPDVIRSDNGSPFASASLTGLTRLSAWWARLGVLPERIDAGCPEQNGRHERMHRTLKQETTEPPGSTHRTQQRTFDDFRHMYNDERPHEALDMACPADLYYPAPRDYPERQDEQTYPDDVAVRRVGSGGTFKYDGATLYLTRLLKDELVGIEQTDRRYAKVHFNLVQLAWLDKYEEKMLPVADYSLRDEAKAQETTRQ